MDNWQEYDKFKVGSEYAAAYYKLVADCLDKGIQQATENVTCQTALDIACGYGDSTRPLLDVAPHIDGVDLSEALIEKAKADPSLDAINFYCSDFLAFEPPVQYDLTLATWFHNQLATEEMQIAARDKIRDLVTDNGQFVFILPNKHHSGNDMLKLGELMKFSLKVLERLPKCTPMSYSVDGDETVGKVFFWDTEFIKSLYDEDFECHFVDCDDVFHKSSLYTSGILQDLYIDILVGRKR